MRQAKAQIIIIMSFYEDTLFMQTYGACPGFIIVGKIWWDNMRKKTKKQKNKKKKNKEKKQQNNKNICTYVALHLIIIL